MKLLLDTHILLWSLLEPTRLTRDVAVELESRNNELWLSPISTWEVIVLVEKGRVVLETDPATWLRSVYKSVPFKEAPVNHEVAIQSRLINLPYQDPADRFLVGTALVYGLTLVTADPRIVLSKVIPVLPNKISSGVL